MKKIHILFTFIVLICCVSACKDDTEGITPSKPANLRAEPCEGGVILRWETPETPDYLYVRLCYQHPVTGEKIKRNASTYVDSILVDGMFAKDGEYEFTVSTVSSTETQSESEIIRSTALPVQPVIKKQSEKVLLTIDNVSTNAQEASEGPIENLVNGNYKDFFHSDWHNPGSTKPHYIDIALPEPLEHFEIIAWERGGARNWSSPYIITILGSNDGSNWTEIQELKSDGTGEYNDRYITPVLGEEGTPYSYIRYRVDETVENTIFFALAELEIYKVWYDVYDPEGIYNPEE